MPFLGILVPKLRFQLPPAARTIRTPGAVREFGLRAPAHPTRLLVASSMKTFSIQTLGCKVNHYESEQLAQLLRERGLRQTEPAAADLRVINTCSVTTAAASQSRQAVRRVVRLPLLAARAAAQPQSAPSQGAHQHGALGAEG